MLTTYLPVREQSLRVVPEGVTVVLAENGGRSLALILPPLEDIGEMAALREVQYSLTERSDSAAEGMRHAFRAELKQLREKKQQFLRSLTYHNRVATLAALAGDLDEAAHSIESARELTDDRFFAHRAAENLLTRGFLFESEALFTSLDLDSDVYANLRLAFFHVQRQEMEGAQKCIGRALSIDPLDFSARLFEGGLALANQDFERAIHSFRLATEERETSSLNSNMGIAYAKLGLVGKAFGSLKRAVALDPMNVNALTLLADLSFREGRNEDALPSLRYFVEFEQKHPGIWARLARAAVQLGQVDEAIAALKRHGSLNDTSAVWNNLGVAYQTQGNAIKSREAFKHAMVLGERAAGRDYFLAARNLVQSLWRALGAQELLELTSLVLARDVNELCVRDSKVSDICIFHVCALRAMGRVPEAVALTEQLLAREHIADPLAIWAVSSLIAEFALRSETANRAKEFIEHYESRMVELTARNPQKRNVYFNNAAFAFAETGDVEAAERYLSRISSAIHEEPYPTATLGLVHIRKGHIDRAKELYEEAIGLARDVGDKTRIRQKLNLELGRAWIPKNSNMARRSLERARDIKDGEPALREQALQLLLSLPRS